MGFGEPPVNPDLLTVNRLIGVGRRSGPIGRGAVSEDHPGNQRQRGSYAGYLPGALSDSDKRGRVLNRLNLMV